MRLRTPSGVKVLLIDEDPERLKMFEGFLSANGYETCRAAASEGKLMAPLSRHRPDVLMISRPRLDAETISEIESVQTSAPLPIVVFSEDHESETIRAAVAAGVNAYVVVGINANRVRSAIDVAVAQFKETQGLKGERDEATAALAERKLVERAKGIIMKSRGMAEDEAYRFMRKTAMDRNMRLGDLARTLIDAAELLT